MPELNFKSVLAWAVYGGAAFMCARLINTLDRLETSVSSLNVQSANWSRIERQVDDHESRLRAVEICCAIKK